ncbi:MAG: DUF11 domain-containing protein [Phormidesmis sp.]
MSCFAGFYAPSALAEGSNDLVSSGGDRPYLEFRTDTNGGILRRTIIKVYVNQGETIDLGSSAVGLGNGTINYRRPNNTNGTCGTSGVIANRSQEAAGPGDGTGGTFIPCKVTVGAGQTGIWEIDFVSPDAKKVTGGDSNPPPISGIANWTQANNSGLVSAWDVTVRSSGGSKIPGRVYANYYAFNMGDNSRELSSLLYVLTKEGYQYSIDLNGLDPFGFIFFSNRNGFFNKTTGNSIFRSLQFINSNPGDLPPGYAFQNPNDPDAGIYVTQKTFINLPDPNMPASANSPTGITWLYSFPVAPPTPTGFTFTGIEGTPGQAGTTPLGGTLKFNSTSNNAYSISIDINQDGIFGNDGASPGQLSDRTFVGRSVVGPNSVFWDGKDGKGATVPASTIAYNVRLNQYAGEAHFPLIDAEQHNSGFKIKRLNAPVGPTSAAENPNNIYYDDRNTGTNYTLCAGIGGEIGVDCYGGPPTPRQALLGVNSSAGRHEFTNDFGNRRGIDTWVYYPSIDVDLSGGIVVRQADLIVNKAVNLPVANPGDTLTYTITVKNDGPSNEDGITFQDNVPATLSNVTWSCSITSGTGACGTASGTGNAINTTLNLNNQAVATYIVIGKIATNASGSISNTAEAIRNKDITDPNLNNNKFSVVTTLNSTPPVTGALCYAVANSNDQLVKIDINTGAENSIGAGLGVPNVAAIAYWPITGTLYASNASQLGTVNTTTGTYTNRGNFGSGNGSLGTKTFSAVDGLTFHPFTGELYGSVRNAGGNALLIKINPTTGARIANAFGTGNDYLVIAIADVADIAFDPETGYLYGIGGANADRLIRINPTTGAIISNQPLGTTKMQGLSAYNNGSLYGTTSDAVTQNNNRFYRINKATGAATPINPLAVGRSYDAVDCLTADSNRAVGNVFLDKDESATLNAGDTGTANANVRLYRDLNGNGQVDIGDILLTSQNTAGAGTFDFRFAANGSFVMDVDATTLPLSSNVFTTDNVEVASFGSGFGLTDTNNNFGHYTNSNLAIVKRITAINGVRLTDSVDDPADNNDNHPKWPAGTSSAGISTFLAGATENFVEPGDVVEYTIYYLATGNYPVTNVKLCDRVPTGATFIPSSMVLFTNNNTRILTDTNTDQDGAEFSPIGTPTPAVACPGNNTNGTVLVNLAQAPNQLPNATGPGNPSDAYGFIRFRVTVN